MEDKLDDSKMLSIRPIAEEIPPSDGSNTPSAPPGVSIKEGLSEDFIKQVKKVLGKEKLPEPTEDDVKEFAKNLRKVYGATPAAYICKQDTERDFSGVIRGRTLDDWEKNAIIRANDITKILTKRLTNEEAKDWMMVPSSYLLDEVPFMVIRDDPELVRKAALMRVA